MKSKNHLPVAEFMLKWVEAPFEFENLLSEAIEAKSKIGKAILGFGFTNNTNFSGSEARKLSLEIVNSNEVVEINFFAKFLLVWAQRSLTYNFMEEGSWLIRKIKALKKSDLILPVKIEIIEIEGYFETAKGNKLGRVKKLNEALMLLPKKSKFAEKTIANLNLHLADEGLLLDRDKETERYLKNNISDDFKQVNQLTYLRNHLQTFQLKKATAIADDIIQNGLKFKNFRLKNHFENYLSQCILDLDFLKAPLSYESQYVKFKNSSELTPIQYWYFTNIFLYKKDPKEALIWSRKAYDNNAGRFSATNLSTYIHIRAELVCKNAEGAKNFLKKKITSGNPHYFDNFFFARVALIENKTDLASQYFNKAREGCEKYDALPRLDYEIDLSCELTTRDIRILFGNSQMKQPIDEYSLEDTNNKSTTLGLNKLIGRSQVMNQLKNDIKKYSHLSTGIILINGETGVGKDVVASAIHETSNRKQHPYLAINCGAIAEQLLQSELFGHEAGSYTGAQKAHKGIFEAAGKGTVFLDEIGEISELVQVSLLRVLEGMEVRPVGSTVTKKIHCRIIVATNKNLKLLFLNGKFREDLYYRLNQLRLTIPALRDRKEDIELLITHFLTSGRSDKQIPKLDFLLLNAMKSYPWPGNVRELKHEIERMRLLNSEKLYYQLEDTSLFKTPTILPTLEPIKKITAQLDQSTINHNSLQAIIDQENSPLRRRDRMIEVFKQYKKLTRSEIIKHFKIAPSTATLDLKHLQKIGAIKKVEPSASRRSHYFVVIE